MLDMRVGTKRRGALLLRGLAFGLVLGASLGGLFGFVFGTRPLAALVGALSGMLNVSVMTLVIVGGEIFFPRTRLGRALEAAPFVMTVAIKALVYGAVITLVFGGSMGRRIVGAALLTPDAAAEALQGAMPRAVAIGIAFSLSLSFILVLQLGRLIGEQTLLDIVLGRYHRPRAEERFFLFVDIVGSTPLAERIGPAAVHRFLGEVFRLASDPIDDPTARCINTSVTRSWSHGRLPKGVMAPAHWLAYLRSSGRWRTLHRVSSASSASFHGCGRRCTPASLSLVKWESPGVPSCTTGT